MVTINIFPPPDASQKQTEQKSGASEAPGPAQFTSTEMAMTESSQPSPSMQMQELTAGTEVVPSPAMQFGSFQEQGFANTDAPVPSMDFLNLTGDFQSSPDPVFSPGNDQSTSVALPFPSMIPPEDDTEGAGKSLTKKK
jgi:hypothetical protein